MKKKDFQDQLLAWFGTHGRLLPWRQEYLPYHVWISEIMLQQTQMERAVAYFKRWVERFPDIVSITRASEDEIFRMWEGLGYYSRARNLKKTAELLVTHHDGRLPEDRDTLLSLPGIGPYTAGAIMSLAFKREYPIVDGNVERVFARVFDIRKPVKHPESQTFIWKKAQVLIPKGAARDFNQSLMELGALVCLPQRPKCGQCPISSQCLAFVRGIVAERPIPGDGKKIIKIEMATGVLIEEGRVFIQKRLPGDVWAGLWEFPGGRLKKGEKPSQAMVREFLEETGFTVEVTGELGVAWHGYTIYRVTLHGFFCRRAGGRSTPQLTAAQECRWVKPEELTQFAFPAGHRRLIDRLINLLKEGKFPWLDAGSTREK